MVGLRLHEPRRGMAEGIIRNDFRFRLVRYAANRRRKQDQDCEDR